MNTKDYPARRLDGGARGIGRTLYQSRPMQNQNKRPIPAERMDLIAALRAFARHALETTPDLTLKEKRFLEDMCRHNAVRYGFGALDNLFNIAPRVGNPHAFEEAIRGQVIKRLAPQNLCVVDAFLTETRAQAVADVDQSLFLIERLSVRRDAALQSCFRHLTALRTQLDAYHVWPRFA